MERVLLLDSLKGIAVIGVILYHIQTLINSPAPKNILEKIIEKGYWGVPLFFFVSGCTIAMSLRSRNLSWLTLKNYFLRRLIRIEPPYFIVLTLVFIARVFFKGQNFSDLFYSYLASFFYLHNFFFEEPSYIFGAAWSLEVEIQFYLVAPLFIFMLLKAPRSLKRGLYLFLIGVGYVLHQRFALSLLGNLHFFCVGMWTSEFIKKKDSLNHLVFLNSIGKCCYSFYLVQGAFLSIVVKMLVDSGFSEKIYVIYFLSLTIIFLLSILFYLVIEKPFLNISRKITQ